MSCNDAPPADVTPEVTSQDAGFQSRETEIPASRLLRVLQIEADAIDATIVDRALRKELKSPYELDRVENLESALERLEQYKYDAILLDLTLPDGAGIDALRKIASRYSDTPILVLSGDEDPVRVSQAIRDGAHDFLFKSRLSGGYLTDKLRSAIADRATLRADTRYDVANAAVMYPILPDGSPGEEIPATVVDLSIRGIGLLADRERPASDLCLVGLERPDGSCAYATVDWKYGTKQHGGIRLGGAFVTGRQDPLDKSKLVPRLNTTSLRMALSIGESIVQKWVQRGVAQPYPVDRILTCPSCQAIPTMRYGCADCGSPRTQSAQLIHHYACAHVATAAEFENENTLVCPKCLRRNLVVGADFEHLDGPTTCRDCSWSGDGPVLIGECMRCGRRFPGSEAHDMEVAQFHVERLDPLEIIQSRT